MRACVYVYVYVYVCSHSSRGLERISKGGFRLVPQSGEWRVTFLCFLLLPRFLSLSFFFGFSFFSMGYTITMRTISISICVTGKVRFTLYHIRPKRAAGRVARRPDHPGRFPRLEPPRRGQFSGGFSRERGTGNRVGEKKPTAPPGCPRSFQAPRPAQTLATRFPPVSRGFITRRPALSRTDKETAVQRCLLKPGLGPPAKPTYRSPYRSSVRLRGRPASSFHGNPFDSTGGAFQSRRIPESNPGARRGSSTDDPRAPTIRSQFSSDTA